MAREFKDILGDRESDDLNDAGGVLLHISHAADIALKQARALEKRLKEEENSGKKPPTRWPLPTFRVVAMQSKLCTYASWTRVATTS